MHSTHTPFGMSLAHKALFSVADAADVRIACQQGAIWITLDNDERDYVIEAGQSFTTPEHRRALLYAIGPSRITVEATQTVRAPARTHRSLTLQQLPA